MTSAAAPETSGAANEVPLAVAVETAERVQAEERAGKLDADDADERAENTPSPGAASEMYVPVLENAARVPVLGARRRPPEPVPPRAFRAREAGRSAAG